MEDREIKDKLFDERLTTFEYAERRARELSDSRLMDVRARHAANKMSMKERSVDDSEEDSSTINVVRRDSVYDDRDILTIDQRPLNTVTHPVVYVVDARRWMYSLKLREDAMPVISSERGIPFALLPVVA